MKREQAIGAPAIGHPPQRRVKSLDRPRDRVRIGDEGRTTWVAVDRPVYVALTLPDGSGPTPIQVISGAVTKAMPAVKPNPGPVR